MDKNKEDRFIELLEEHGSIDAVIPILAREDNENWRCPVCEEPLSITGQKQYETGSEHVIDPNREEFPLRDAYQCTNKKCVACHKDTFWNYEGDLYSRDFHFDEHCVNNNDAPFGSLARKSNVEIYKKGLKKKTYLHPILCLWFLQPMIEYEYKANKEGEVLSKSFTIKFLKKSRGQKHYSTYWTPCWRTWSFLYGRFRRSLQYFKESGKSDELDRAFRPSFNRAWVYRSFEWFINTFYSQGKLRKKYQYD